MAYTTQAKLEARIPATFLAQALSDDEDNSADSGLLETVIDEAEQMVNSRIGQRYETPLTGTIPAIVQEAATIFACELVYERRGMSGEQNPWYKRASGLRSKLTAIGNGTQPLTPNHDRADASVTAITSDSKVHSDAGSIPT